MVRLCKTGCCIYRNYFISRSISSKPLGTKIIRPIITEKTTVISTAPAAISFTRPAVLFFSGDTRFTKFSIAVFIISIPITMLIQSKHNSHSVMLMLKINPQITTSRLTIRCILMLASEAKTYCIPLIAKPKLLVNLLIS